MRNPASCVKSYVDVLSGTPPEEDSGAVRKEIKRVLKAGGCVVGVDFGRATRRGLLGHFHRHGRVEVENIVKLFVDAGLRTNPHGPLDMNDPNFVIADAPSSWAPDHADGE